MTHSDDLDVSRAQLQRLQEEHRNISSLLECIQELTRNAIRLDSVAELFSTAFRTFFRCVEFDVAAAVVLEQHLDLHVMTRYGSEGLISERLISLIRDSLRSLIPPSFLSADVVVISEASELPELAGPADSLAFQIHSILELENRTAGIVLLYSSRSFSDDDRELLAIYSTQLSMLLANIHARERIVNLAETDDLTGIWNRRYFNRHLPQEVERARVYSVPLALLVIDVDDFKEINDQFGHTAGDVVLSEVCGAVRETLRPPDLFARYGGDEFSLILPHTDLAGARAVAERILAVVNALSIESDGGDRIRCTVSIGVAEFRLALDLTASDLFRRADDLLYQSKREGKNRYTA